MAEDDDLDPRYPNSEAEVSVRDLMAWLKTKDYSCEVCKSKAWFTTADPDGNAISIVWKPAILREPGYDLFCYPVLCLECGNAKIFSKLLLKYEIKRLLDEAADRKSSGHE